MRVCLDTNVLVAAFAARGLCADVLRIVLAEHDLVIGEPIRTELRRALTVKIRLPAERAAAIDLLLASLPQVPRPSRPSATPVRDASDRWILALAEEGGAEVLVTGDADLLAVRDKAKLPILNPRAFWTLLHEARTR